MGKKRITAIDLSKEEPKKVKEKKRALVKSGKQHGRITDMGTVMLEEMEKRKETEKKGLLRGGRKPSSEVAGKKKKAPRKKKAVRPQKLRSQRYQAIKKLIKSDKLYPLPEAIELLKKAANAQFEETVELHLVTTQAGRLTKEIKTEKKAPLAHIKIGKTSWTKKKLLENIQALIETIGPNKITKAVLTSTMGPGIKIDLTKAQI